MNYLQRLFFKLFHRHKWEIKETCSLKLEYWNGAKRFGLCYILRCTECGEIRQKDLI